MNLNEAIQLGAQLLGSGRFSDAKKLCEEVVSKMPNSADAHHFLGIARHQLGESSAGIQSIQKAIKIDKTQVGFHLNLAHVLREVGRTAEAKTYYSHVLKLAPENMQAMLGLGQCALAERAPKEALFFFEKAASGGETFQGVVLSQMVIAHIMLGQESIAIEKLKEAIVKSPKDPLLISTLGSLYQSEENYIEAKVCYEKSHSLKPSAMAAGNLGAVHKIMGDMASAEAFLQEAIKRDEAHGAAYYELSMVADAESFEKYAEKLLELCEGKQTRQDDKARMHFALYVYYKKQKQTEKAMGHLVKANDLYGALVQFDLKAERAFFKVAAEVISPERLNALMAQGNPSDAPIFIVGMPRSGTTLTEQILSSHSQVKGMGELKFISQALGGAPYEPNHYKKLGDASFAEKALTYLEKVKNKGWHNTPHFTDKMPSNFLYVSGIRAMFPKAKIIHVTRSPMAACFSNYEQLFVEGQHWSYDQRNLGQYYTLYKGLMTHFSSYENLNMFTLSYEDLVSDTEATVRKLLEHCELPWEESVMEFYAQKRDVSTASAVQVRSPIYKTSVDGWKAHEDKLDVLKNTLEQGGAL
jgi:tetratricopeptide (TPR) repeat protein